ncbi:thyroid transcription factor 1-associated protein 26-like [Symphalangus syndactylus]|uniref:thyroid transcription factor 1-associated protein 26-like n=1 Tax=Symphalangus syndactylus TaxID=9590 RepID=UPI0024416327|nr:thyroid transcription factor 1-associated protein 26-like [Symphalangus syndactylus]
MAPVRRAAKWRPGGFEVRGEGVSTVGYRNKNVKQKTWRPNHPQAFVGSVREGQGFAFRRKLRIQQSYKKLLWKEKKAQMSLESHFTDRNPDNLKHLYFQIEERLRKQPKKVDHPLSEQVHQPLLEQQCSIDQALFEDQCSFDQPQPEEQCSKTVNSFTIPKKNKTSNQKAQEEYEQVQAKRAAKKQEFERRKQEREAQRQYKKKKMEVFKIWNKKTKKGQPNLNVQIEYLLQKIQEKSSIKHFVPTG